MVGAHSNSIMLKYNLLNDPALVEMAKVVHAADVSDDIDASPYGRGLRAIAYGFKYLHGTEDHRKIELEIPMYDALYAFFEHEVAESSSA